MAPLLPTLAAHARNLISTGSQAAATHWSRAGPLVARSILTARSDSDNDNDDTQVDPSIGVTDPGDINNTFIFVLFGLIGVAFVITGIWFFFWAKNGGFYFKQNDWDDYKSTVLRRKGPNGTLLSGATPSTNLGGGSIYKDIDDTSTEYTGGLTEMTGTTGTTDDTMSTLTGVTAGASDIAGRERRRKQREKKEREHEKKKDKKNRKSRRKMGEDGALVDEEDEEAAKRHLRAYRSERAARVGGMNRESEASEWDGSTNPEMSSLGGSLLSGRQSTPTSTPTKKERRADKEYKEYDEKDFASTMTTEKKDKGKEKEKEKKGGGIRKVYSTADRMAKHENDRLRAEAKRLAEKGRKAGSSVAGSSNRDYSFQRADLRAPIEEESASMLSGVEQHQQRFLPPGNWAESDIGDGSDLGTKSYAHHIPGLSVSSGVGGGSEVGSNVGSDYAEEKRRKRGAQRYRRE
ncbi:hypothetical protein GGR57DRAFT_461579 [Xylariaceae sp. FL1272]|nr:hypothetical protein GGR57DRAFT_461579 [Xylariaceae sp. FL1272]